MHLKSDCSGKTICSLAESCGFYACRSVSQGAFCINDAEPSRMLKDTKQDAGSRRRGTGYKVEFLESRIIDEVS